MLVVAIIIAVMVGAVAVVVVVLSWIPMILVIKSVIAFP